MQGFGNMMNLTAIYRIYGEEKGINIYKYFDLHSMMSSILAQFFVSFFGSSYFNAMIFFSIFNVAGMAVISQVSFPIRTEED